ncbi:oxidoreductase activity protein [[Candida] boidinii]|nr:oxidoreductase activity protein [[Candida] boidinii]
MFRFTVGQLSRKNIVSNLVSNQFRKNNVIKPLSLSLNNIRFYSHAPPLTKEIITERIIELLESYSKIKEDANISMTTSFSKDLGLDSFDTVEIIMEMENEFSIIIPDHEADEIKTVGQAVEYIVSQDDAC